MSKLQAAGAIKLLAKQYKDMVEAAEILEKIGSLEQAMAEAETRWKKDEATRARVLADHDAVMRGLMADSERVKVEADEAYALARRLIDEAKTEAGQIRQAAAMDFQAVVDGAKAAAALAVAEENEKLADMRRQAATLEGEIAALNKRRVAAEKATGAAQEKLDTMRTAMQALLG